MRNKKTSWLAISLVTLLATAANVTSGTKAFAQDANRCSYIFSTRTPVSGEQVGVEVTCPSGVDVAVEWVLSNDWYYTDHYYVGSGYVSSIIPSGGTCGFNGTEYGRNCSPYGLILWMVGFPNDYRYLSERALIAVGRVSFPKQLTKTPIPKIYGQSVVGSTLSLDSGIWDSGVSKSYQWRRSGATITDATSSSYVLTSDDLLSQITAEVTGTLSGYTKVTKVSSSVNVILDTLALQPIPIITGLSEVGATLTASSGTWDSDVQFSYQWLRDGSSIAGAIETDYVLGPLDYQTRILVQITGTKPGYISTTKTSDDYLVAAGSLTRADVPTVYGDSVPFGVLSVSNGDWDSDVSFTYQWLRNGVEIAGATSSNYVLGVTDVGQNLSVNLTGSKEGFVTVTKTSADSLVGAGSFSQTPVPSISGTAAITNSLTAIPGTWDSGSTLTYQWLRDGVAIPGATSSSYTLQASDYLKKISVAVTGSKEGYISETKTSNAVIPVKTKEKIASLRFTGSFKVGEKAYVAPSNRNGKFDYSYQWLRDGVEIAGATSRTYLIASEDLGSNLSARVCALYQKDVSHCVSQDAGSTVQLGVLKNVKASISGVAKVGRMLNSTPVIFDKQATVAYQWHRNGDPIVDATRNSYFIDLLDKGSSISLRVTVTKPGYETEVKTSSSKLIN
jgi:hypothetical protein